MTDREWLAWCAGFYDGEGSTGCYVLPKNPRGRISMVIGQKQSEPGTLETFARSVGIGLVVPHSRKEPDRWRWAVYRPHQVAEVGSLIWPWLGHVKRLQYLNAWRKWNALRGERGFDQYPFNAEIYVALSEDDSI